MENDRRIVSDKIARIGAWGASSYGPRLNVPVTLTQKSKPENRKSNEAPVVTHAPIQEPGVAWAPRGKRQLTW